MADDGLFGSTTAQMTIAIGQPASPQITSAAWNLGTPGAESFDLNFSGTSNATYSVWAATNLVDWVRLGPAIESSPGQYEFTDAAATNWPQRFYRVSSGQ